MASISHAAWDTDRPSSSPNAADLQAVPSLLTQYMACTPCTAPTSHAAWDNDSRPAVLTQPISKLYRACSRSTRRARHAQRGHPTQRGIAPGRPSAISAAVVVAPRGKNASARSSSVRRRAIPDARSCVPKLLAHRALDPPPSSSLAEERTPPLAPPPCDGARFPTLAAASGGQLDDVAPT
jgi:hypothetical protein